VTDFLYFQTTIQMRVPIKEDGTPGHPEIVKRWTSPYKGAQHMVKKATPKPKKVPPRTMTIQQVETGEL